MCKQVHKTFIAIQMDPLVSALRQRLRLKVEALRYHFENDPMSFEEFCMLEGIYTDRDMPIGHPVPTDEVLERISVWCLTDLFMGTDAELRLAVLLSSGISRVCNTMTYCFVIHCVCPGAYCCTSSLV